MTDQTLEQVIAAWYTDDARGSHLDFDDVPALAKRLEAFRQDRTVQVPVSLPTREQIAEAEALITEADGALSVIGDGDWTWQDTMLRRLADHYRATLALLSQPTPTAEPTRVEDLTPGTLLELGKRWTVARDHDGVTFLYAENDGYSTLMPASAVDPSTIRDVTPPAVTL